MNKRKILRTHREIAEGLQPIAALLLPKRPDSVLMIIEEGLSRSAFKSLWQAAGPVPRHANLHELMRSRAWVLAQLTHMAAAAAKHPEALPAERSRLTSLCGALEHRAPDGLHFLLVIAAPLPELWLVGPERVVAN